MNMQDTSHNLSYTFNNPDSVNIINKLNDRESLFSNEGDEDSDSIFVKNTNCKYFNEEQFINSTYNASANQFSLIHFNARSLYKNFDSICAYLLSLNYPFSIVGITETWMYNRPNIFSLTGYTFIQSARLSGRGGGVAFFIDDQFTFRILDKINFDIVGVESLFIEIESKSCKNMIIGVVYRKPSSSAIDFINRFENIVHSISMNHKTCYIMGDFNLNLLDFTKVSSIGNFLNMFFSFGFYPLINKPTRLSIDSATLLDNIFTNSTYDSIVSGICVSDISDHFPIFSISSIIGSRSTREVDTKCFARNITPTSVASLTNDLRITDWNMVLQSSDVNTAYDIFLDSFTTLCDKHIPYQKKKSYRRNEIKKPWITLAILKFI